MKNKLEICWLILQITAVIIAGFWGVTRWQISDREKLKPAFDPNVVGLNGIQWNGDGRSIGALWKIKNIGNTPFKIENIKYQFFGVKDDFTELKKGEERNQSLGKLLANAEFKSDIYEFEKSDDLVTVGATISRDILWQYRPEANNSNMFDNHRIAIKITGDVSSIFSWWCPICPSTNEETTIITELRKY